MSEGATVGATDGLDPSHQVEQSPEFRAAVVDLLGALAYGELMAFSQLARDAESAPSHPDRAEVSRLAVAEFQHYEAIVARLEQLGVDPEGAIAPFVDAVDHFHERTAPNDWLEGLVKAYVGDGI
ncbi:MAG: ferritin-like domain-containing protein, partial [Actinomycetota bacterium]|nr:ferritin-like domain-containing protein [Actinomycetota bacterium]